MKAKTISILLAFFVIVLTMTPTIYATNGEVTIEDITVDNVTVVDLTVDDDVSVDDVTVDDSTVDDASVDDDIMQDVDDGDDKMRSVDNDVIIQGDAVTDYDVIFVNDDGNDTNDGLTEETAVKTLEKAYSLLQNGGTIVVSGKLTIDSNNANWPDNSETIVITSVYNDIDYQTVSNAEIYFSSFINLNGPTVFRNITFHAANTMLVVCNGNDVTFDAGITCMKDKGTDIAIIGGKDATTSDTTETASVKDYTITVNSGTWSYVRGGNRRGSGKSAVGTISGVNVIINGGEFTGTDSVTSNNEPDDSKIRAAIPAISPGGYANLDGDLYLEINGGSFNCSIFGIARPGTNQTNTLLSNKGNVEIKITGGTFNGFYVNAVQDPVVTTLNGSYSLIITGGIFNNIRVLSAENVIGSSTADVTEDLNDLLVSFQKAVFVANYGDDNASGKSSVSALKTLDAAYDATTEGGIIVVCGKLTLSSNYSIPANSNEIKLTSVYGGIDYRQTEDRAEIILGDTIILNGKTVFSDITLNALSDSVIKCNGYDTTFEKGVECSGIISVVGGNNKEGYAVNINSGTWSGICGGSADNGSTISIIIGGGTFNNISAGGESVAKGNHYIEINGGTFLGDINGVLSGSEGDVSMVINDGVFSDGKISATKEGTVNGHYSVIITGGDFTNNPTFSAEGVMKTSTAYVPSNMSNMFNDFDVVTEPSFVYVKDEGNGDGTSPENAFGNLTDAYNALSEGGTIIVCGPLTLNGEFNAPANNGQIIITSIIGGADYRHIANAQINLGSTYYINGPTIFENIRLNTIARDTFFCCNGNTTVFGEGIECTLASPKMVYPGITAGANINAAGEDGTSGTNLTIKSGSWQIVRGGNRRAALQDTMRTIEGDINLLITGGEFYGNVTGGGQNNQIGDINFTIEGGNFTRSLYALCLPSSSALDVGTHSGNVTVTINGGTFCGIIGPVQDFERAIMNGKYTININGGDYRSVTTLQGTEGLSGEVESEIYIGDNIDINKLQTGVIEFTNPVSSGQDPSITYHDGYYYYMYAGSYNGRVCLYMSKALNLCDIGKTTFKMIWQPEEGSEYGKMIWSPKLYYLDGSWYIYAACSPDVDPNLRIYVLKGKTDDPMGEYELIEKMNKIDSRWAIGPHIMELDEKRYFMFTGNTVGEDGVKDLEKDYQTLNIAEMENPWTLATDPVEICKPDYSWEKNGWNVVEGATFLESPNGKAYIVYSASGAWTDDYCLGMLSLVGDDPLVPENWVKYPEPVFSRVPDIYGPGHAAFTKSIDGTEDWIVYHANLNQNAGFSGRSIFIQKFTWDENDVPQFGEPLPLGTVQTWKTNPMPLAEKIEGFQNYIPPEDDDDEGPTDPDDDDGPVDPGDGDEDEEPTDPDDDDDDEEPTVPGDGSDEGDDEEGTTDPSDSDDKDEEPTISGDSGDKDKETTDPGDASGDGDPALLGIDDLSYVGTRVEVKLSGERNRLSGDAEDKLIEENKDKDIIITGNKVRAIIRKGSLSAGDSINNMIVDTSKITDSKTQVVQYTDKEGNAQIVKFSMVNKELASYIATKPGNYEIIDNKKKVDDINRHWANDSINFVLAHEIFKGVSDTEFDPDGNMTRAMFVTVLGRLHDSAEKDINSNIFNDVQDGMWYTDYVAWAYKNDIVKGNGSGSFCPDNDITREELCTMLHRYIKFAGIELEMLPESETTTFRDNDDISSWAQEAASIMQRTNLIKGKPGNIFDPKGKATRAEVATILYRLIESVMK